MADEHSDYYSVGLEELRWGTTYEVKAQAVGDNYSYVDSQWSEIYEFETVAHTKDSHSYAYYPNGYHGVVQSRDLPMTPPPIQVTTQTAYGVEVVTGYYEEPRAAIEVTIGLSKSTLRAWTQDVHTVNVNTDYIMMGGTSWR